MLETPNYAAAALLLPPTGLVLLALGALVALAHRARTRVVVVALALVALLASSLPVVALALMRTLEPPPLGASALREAQAIVILGGGRNRSAPEWGGVTLGSFLLERVRYGARLARETTLPVLVSGGAPGAGGVTEGALMRDALQKEFGVPVRWVDTDSRTTRENARFAARELLPLGLRRTVLVTSGWHSARAGAEFARHGLEVIAAPTGLIAARPFSPYHLVPNAESLYYTHIALREWVAAIWYRWSG
jgi:uncharacterized SAM-binding protein YcdF (DUF218 family)